MKRFFFIKIIYPIYQLVEQFLKDESSMNFYDNLFSIKRDL